MMNHNLEWDLEWEFIDVDMPVKDAKKLAEKNKNVMLVKCFPGDGYYCGCCGCWLKYDGHSFGCPYYGER